MWESFPKGGCFIKKIKKNEGNLLDRMWEELVTIYSSPLLFL